MGVNPNCDLCGLCEKRKHVTQPRGEPSKARLFIVLSYPSQKEDEEGKVYPPELLKRFAKPLGWKASDLYITNAVKCYSEGVKPGRKEQRACYEVLKKEIEQVRPKAILALGKFAAGVITHQPTLTLSDLREDAWDVTLEDGTKIPVVLSYSFEAAQRKYEQNDKSIFKILGTDIKHATEIFRGKKVTVRKKGVFTYIDFFSTPYAHFHIVQCKKCSAESHQNDKLPVAICPSCKASTSMQSLKDSKKLLLEREKNSHPRYSRF